MPEAALNKVEDIMFMENYKCVAKNSHAVMVIAEA